jgi:cysteine desulfurase
MIYLDHNSTTAVSPAVLEKMNEVYGLKYINPSSVHGYGLIAKKYLQEARQQILKSLNAGEDYEIIFTASSTESNNLALSGKEIITTKTEHASVLNLPCETIFVNVDTNGLVDSEELRKYAHNGRTISIIWANHQTGVVQDIGNLLNLKNDCFFHTDATQYIGKRLIDLKQMPVDAITFCGHKIGGGHGIACLVYRKNFKINPILYGGLQEGGIRAGTYNLPAIVGFAYAVANVNDVEYLQKYQKHTQKLVDTIAEYVLQNGGLVLPQHNEKISNTICIAKRGLLNSEQAMIMDLNGICVSVGSACHAGISNTKSYVLQAMGFDDEISSCAIRVSVGMENTESDIAKFCEAWKRM